MTWLMERGIKQLQEWTEANALGSSKEQERRRRNAMKLFMFIVVSNLGEENVERDFLFIGLFPS